MQQVNLGFVSIAIGVLLFFVSQRTAGRVLSSPFKAFAWFAAVLLAAPGVLYASYYFRLMGEPLWLYRLRTVPGTELLASMAGILAGLTQHYWIPRLKLSSLGRKMLMLVVLVFVLSLPHLKPVLRPLKRESLKDRWENGVCLQSTMSTCGPASVATILRKLGTNVSERELADEAWTSDRGTENWYLARALNRRGFKTTFTSEGSSAEPPALLGVRLSQYGSGHFIALLDRIENKLVIADPMEGCSTNSIVELNDRYEFTGFALLIRK
jgi:hypothetical protein